MERWIKTRTREMQGKYKFVMDLWKSRQKQGKCKENTNLYWTYRRQIKTRTREMQICNGLMEGG